MKSTAKLKFYCGCLSKNFTQIPNEIIEHKQLSDRAKVLWQYLRSRPDGWIVRRNQLQKQMRCGKNALSAALKELEDHGFLGRFQHNQNGVFGASEYAICFPAGQFNGEPFTENSDTVEPLPQIPLPQNPSDGLPVTANEDTYKDSKGTNTDSISNIDKDSDIPPIPPREMPRIDYDPERFMLIGITGKMIDEWQDKYPNVNIEESLNGKRSAREWVHCNKIYLKVLPYMWDFLDNWLHRAAHGTDKPGYQGIKRKHVKPIATNVDDVATELTKLTEGIK